MMMAIDIRPALRALIAALAAVVACGCVAGGCVLWIAEVAIELLAGAAGGWR